MICWSCFTWDAFATLATGIFAVGGAIAIGVRQTRIADKQTQTLERQTQLNELSLRNDLFASRYEVYSDVREFLLHIIRHAEVPEGEVEMSFLQAMGMSRFLYGEAIHGRLQEIWKQACDLRSLKREMARTFERESHYGEGNPQKEYDLLVGINDAFTGLPDLFGDALRLA